MKQENISFQYVPPNCKRRNAAERAIRTFKVHFIATLCTVDKDLLPPSAMGYALTADRIVSQIVSQYVTKITARPPHIGLGVTAWQHGKPLVLPRGY